VKAFDIDFEANVDNNIRNTLFFLYELSKNSPYSHESTLNYTQFLIDMGLVD